MASENREEVVCVTGANGFIGSWLVHTLLSKQNPHYKIHATIFPNSDPSHLFTLHPEAQSRITIFPVNILDSTAVSNAINGCSGVFHVASPCTLEDPTDPQKELLEPAVQGTLNVLEASKRAGVKRVVLTSSISAMVPNPNWPENKAIDEGSWTDVEYCKLRGKWYPVSKTEAEKVAWEFCEKHSGVDVVAVHPGTCLGPLLQNQMNASSAVLQRLMMGEKDTQECYWLGAVHVKDVARAHVLVYETPTAAGRYLCVNGIYQFSSFAKIVSELYHDYPIHSFPNETQPGLTPFKEAAKRLIDLGLVFTPIQDAIREAAESLMAKGFLQRTTSQK
ncbi:putative cinnamoyl-CoA reductase [Medicago truncatula]|uniref:Cinnamoyl-CoA reductase n=1 Tax=Medicago truncatula TaxID=3880 RepID=G7IFT8_MEDTR|nr:cinnamoyl-CoA reductase 1 [Medicago truncatula]AES64689.1 cinnamoyl-CoA reductase [Medicago truncatula]RHN72787.1 putative cinnamoyl-CoA reductase [Medicago truncatula]